MFDIFGKALPAAALRVLKIAGRYGTKGADGGEDAHF
jgi:hypothetical protein